LSDLVAKQSVEGFAGPGSQPLILGLIGWTS